jgi:hypothetical protein
MGGDDIWLDVWQILIGAFAPTTLEMEDFKSKFVTYLAIKIIVITKIHLSLNW